MTKIQGEKVSSLRPGGPTAWRDEKVSKKIQYHWELDVYQISVGSAMQIFEISKKFPKEEIYSLTDQIRRSSRSVSSNIAGSAPVPPRRLHLREEEVQAVDAAVYVIKSLKTGRIYIGQTQNPNKRLRYHNSGYVKSTCDDRPWQLYALENVKSIDEARWLERKLKRSQGMRLRWLQRNRI